jgi:hypothetical protein
MSCAHVIAKLLVPSSQTLLFLMSFVCVCEQSFVTIARPIVDHRKDRDRAATPHTHKGSDEREKSL